MSVSVRLYHRILLCNLDEFEDQGFEPVTDARGFIKVEAWCDGGLETCAVFKEVDEG